MRVKAGAAGDDTGTTVLAEDGGGASEGADDLMQGAELRNDIRVRIGSLRELPPLAPDTQRVLMVLADEETDLDDVAAAIERVPALAARVVGLACSAYFGGLKVRSVAEATIRVLGLAMVRNLALGIAVGCTFDTRRCPRFSPEQHWASAMLTATVARALAEGALTEEPIAPDSAYLCGLLHNLGLLAMVHVAPRETEIALERAAAEPERSLTDIEQEVLGVHHCEVGAWLAMRWQLPPEIGIVMQHQHDPDYRGPQWPLALVVCLAARWTRQHLTGIEEPWMATEWIEALGMDEAVFNARIERCAAKAAEIGELGRLVGGL